MTRLDAGPREVEAPTACEEPEALLLEAREVPLGGVRGMEVHRSLPQRALPMVGAWCFLDRFRPQTAKLRVEPHPHIGLQTVTWPFVGEVRHRDVLGSDVIVRRGVLNLMTNGAGIAHSEYSVGDDAAQGWFITVGADFRPGTLGAWPDTRSSRRAFCWCARRSASRRASSAASRDC